MKIKIPKTQQAREGMVFVAMFVVTAAGIGLYQFIHANPAPQPVIQPVPTTTSNQLTPFYSIFVDSTKTVSSSQQSQTKQLRVKLAIINPSKDPIQIAPGLQMTLVDTNGAGYSMTAKYLAVGQVVGGQLNAGATKSYDVDFELPINATPKSFIFQLDASYKPIQTDI